MRQQEINRSIQGYALEASYYKNCVIALRFFTPLQPNENTKVALLAQLFKDRNLKYATKAHMQAFKDNLYGASLSSRSFSYGPTQVLEVRLSAISERFVNEVIQARQIQGLADIVYQPLINQETLNEAKRSVEDKILRANENPMNFAINRTLEILGPHSTLSLNPQGEINDLASISVDDMISFHKSLILSSQAQIIIGGSFKPGLLNSLGIVFQYHNPLNHEVGFNVYHRDYTETVIELKPIQQATLIEAYQTNISVFEPLYCALRVGNAILGQLPTSHLFQEVREKNSLCYSVGSRIIAFEGLLLLTTSLDASNILLASDLMRKQVSRMQAGDFTQSQFDSAINMLINNLDGIYDDEYAMINFTFDCAYRNLSFDVNDHKTMYRSVTPLQIVEAFNRVNHILQYQLKGESHE